MFMDDLNINVDDTIEKFLSLVKDKNNKICSIKLREDWFIRHGYHKVWNDFLKVTNFMHGTLTEKVRFCMEGKEYWSEDTFPKCCCGKPVAFMDRKVSIYCSHDCSTHSVVAKQRKKEAIAKVDKEKANRVREQTMIKKYGVAYNSQRQDIKHLWSRSSLSPKILKYFETELVDDYVNKGLSALEIGNKIGTYSSTVIFHLKKKGIEVRYGYHESITQKEITQFVESLGFNVETSVVGLIKNRKQEVDIYVREKNVGIEVNGLFWHSGDHKKSNYHIEKTRNFSGRLIHITDYQWANNREICESIIRESLDKSEVINNKETLVELFTEPVKDIVDFFDENDINGFIQGKYYITLKYDNEIVSSIIIEETNDYGASWKILRYTNKLNHKVMNGLFKMLGSFTHHGGIISFVDRSLYDGKEYFDNGWKLLDETDEDYFWTNGNTIILKEETNIPKGYSRYYNCGNLIFKYDSKM